MASGSAETVTYKRAMSLLKAWEGSVVVVSFGQGEAVGRLTDVRLSETGRSPRGSAEIVCGRLEGGADVLFHILEREFDHAEHSPPSDLRIETSRGWLAIEREPAQYRQYEIDA
jgi:hypothetical protein